MHLCTRRADSEKQSWWLTRKNTAGNVRIEMRDLQFLEWQQYNICIVCNWKKLLFIKKSYIIVTNSRNADVSHLIQHNCSLSAGGTAHREGSRVSQNAEGGVRDSEHSGERKELMLNSATKNDEKKKHTLIFYAVSSLIPHVHCGIHCYIACT